MRKLLFILPALLLAAGCGEGGGGSVTAELNGEPFVADDFGAIYWQNARGRDQGTRPEMPGTGLAPTTGRLQLYATAGRDVHNNGDTPLRRIAMTVSGVTGAGRYELVRRGQDIQAFQLAVDDHAPLIPRYWAAPVGDEPLGMLVVSELPAEPGQGKLAGQFAFTLPPGGDDAGFGPLVVTDGRFELPVAVVPQEPTTSDDDQGTVG